MINAPLSTAEQQNLYELGYKIYKKDGQEACEKFAQEQGITTQGHCEACESEEPIILDKDNEITCFVCGSVVEEKEIKA